MGCDPGHTCDRAGLVPQEAAGSSPAQDRGLTPDRLLRCVDTPITPHAPATARRPDSLKHVPSVWPASHPSAGV